MSSTSLYIDIDIGLESPDGVFTEADCELLSAALVKMLDDDFNLKAYVSVAARLIAFADAGGDSDDEDS